MTREPAATGRDDDAPAQPLRVLAHTLALAPWGGVEVCTLQDTVALSGRGHRFALAYQTDGPFRKAYEDVGVSLRGPYDFAFRPRHAVADLRAYLPAARWARRLKPDVVWLNRVEHLPWGQTIARACRRPLVAHLHGPPVFQRMGLIGHGVARFIAVSEFIRQAYIAAGIKPERITLVHNAIPNRDYPPGGLAERREARHRLGLPLEVPIVLCYGQMTTQKGLLTLLEAWPYVRREIPDALLLLVDATSGSPDPAVQAALTRLEPASVRLFGMSADVVPFLHAGDVVAFPTWLPEAFGRVALEAMATARPVVASSLGALPEILSEEMSRFLVTPRSATKLAAKLLEVLPWRTDQPGLGEDAVRWVQDRFRFTAHLDQLEDVLLEVSRPAGRTP